MDAYEEKALAKAKDAGLTAAQVRAMGRDEIIKLGDYPRCLIPDKPFVWKNIRNVVASKFQTEEDEVVKVKRQRALEAHIAADPDLQWLEVEAETKDRMFVRKPKLEAEK